MPDPLDVSPDAARNYPGNGDIDRFSLSAEVDLMTSALQWRAAARIAGATEQEAFRFALHYFETMMRIAAEREIDSQRHTERDE